MATKHTCDGPSFGRLASPGACARCDELRAGAPARRFAWAERSRRDRAAEAARLEAIRKHDCRAAGCGPVCVAFDW
jgi:hypothetical protein